MPISKGLASNRRARLRDPKRFMFYFAKQNAKRSNREFTLKLTDIPDIPQHCPVFPWIKLRVATGEGKRDDSPSLDRLDSNKGYIPGNIRVISWRANMLKRDADIRELVYLGHDGLLLNSGIHFRWIFE